MVGASSWPHGFDLGFGLGSTTVLAVVLAIQLIVQMFGLFAWFQHRCMNFAKKGNRTNGVMHMKVQTCLGNGISMSGIIYLRLKHLLWKTATNAGW